MKHIIFCSSFNNTISEHVSTKYPRENGYSIPYQCFWSFLLFNAEISDTCSLPCSSPELNLISDVAVNAEVSGEHLASLQTLNWCGGWDLTPVVTVLDWDSFQPSQPCWCRAGQCVCAEGCGVGAVGSLRWLGGLRTSQKKGLRDKGLFSPEKRRLRWIW